MFLTSSLHLWSEESDDVSSLDFTCPLISADIPTMLSLHGLYLWRMPLSPGRLEPRLRYPHVGVPPILGCLLLSDSPGSTHIPWPVPRLLRFVPITAAPSARTDQGFDLHLSQHPSLPLTLCGTNSGPSEIQALFYSLCAFLPA